jgi:hypothetical protein
MIEIRQGKVFRGPNVWTCLPTPIARAYPA